MDWICPECGRSFRNKHQWHSCKKLDIEQHLINKSEKILETYNFLIDQIKKFGEISLNPVKTSIQVKAGATFLSLRLKKDALEMEFQLGREYPDFPVYKTVKISGKRYLHFAVVESVEEIDKKLLDALLESYQLVSGVTE